MQAVPRNLIIGTVLFFFGWFGAVGEAASGYEGVKVTVLKKATTAANGQKLILPQTTHPEVTAALVEIPPGGDTGWHSHPIPVYAYVLAGAVTVELGDGSRYDFREGDVLFEVVDTPHIGRNRGTAPVKLVVFYTGVEGMQNTVKAAK